MTPRQATPPAPATPLLAWLAVGFVAGAISVLVLHQGALGVLYGIRLTARSPYAMAPTAPWGVPQLWSLTFWGGLWGLVLALLCWRVARGTRLILGAVVCGALFPTLVAWFIVAPLKGLPLAGGGQLAPIAIALLINGAWGLGVGLGLALLARRSRDSGW